MIKTFVDSRNSSSTSCLSDTCCSLLPRTMDLPDILWTYSSSLGWNRLYISAQTSRQSKGISKQPKMSLKAFESQVVQEFCFGYWKYHLWYSPNKEDLFSIFNRIRDSCSVTEKRANTLSKGWLLILNISLHFAFPSYYNEILVFYGGFAKDPRTMLSWLLCEVFCSLDLFFSIGRQK